MQSFTERMALGKAIAQDLRNDGRVAGIHKSWKGRERPLPTGLDAIEAYLHQFRRDIHYWGVIAVQEALFADEMEDIRRWL
jgi:hypothetical protein